MADPDNGVFIDDFLDDFFAESDEHLTVVRRHLIALDDLLQEFFWCARRFR